MGLLQRVAVLEKDTELEILGIKFRNGFNVEVPYDILHTHPVRFYFFHFVRTKASLRPARGSLIYPLFD